MIRPENPRRILLVRPSALGDVCRTVPVLASVRRAWPEADIDWVVQEENLPAIEAHPALTAPVPFPRRAFAGWWWRPSVMRDVVRWLGDLRRRRYDLVLDCQGLGRSGAITRATGAPCRVGLRRARELAWLGYTRRVPEPASRHAVDRMMALVEALGLDAARDPRLYVADAPRQWWQERRASAGLRTEPYVVLAPTARWPSKRWPAARFAALAPALKARGLGRAVLIGAPGEEDQVSNLVQAAGDGAIVNLVGRTNVGQTMAVLEHASLVVANDSAPLHMAVGLGRPCLGLFGPTEPELVGPYGRPRSVVRKCPVEPGRRIHFKDPALGDSLMRLISVEDVLAQVDGALEDASAARDAAAVSPSGDDET